MKQHLFYILSFLFGVIVQSNAHAQTEGRILEGIVRVAVIEPTPTRPENQQQGQEYVYDYHVLRYLNVSKEQAQEIKRLVNEGKVFDKENMKSCLFEPAFAIVGSTKTKWFPLYMKTRGEVIVSTGQCGKSIIVLDGKESYRDLGQNNALEQLLDALN